MSSARRAKEQHVSAVLDRERKKNGTKFKIPSLRFRSSTGSNDTIPDTKVTLPPILPNPTTSFDNGIGYKPLTPRILGTRSEAPTTPTTPTKSSLKQTTKPKSRGVSWAPANRVRLDTGGDGHELLIDESCLPTPNLPKTLRPLPIAHMDPAKSRKRAFSESTSPLKVFASGEGPYSSPKPYRHSDPSNNSSHFRPSPSRHSAPSASRSLPIESPGSAKRRLRQYVKPLNRRLEALKMKDGATWDVVPTKATHKSKAQNPDPKRRDQIRLDDGQRRGCTARPRYESAPVSSHSDMTPPPTVKAQRHSESALMDLDAGEFPRSSDSCWLAPSLTRHPPASMSAGIGPKSKPPIGVETVDTKPSPLTSFSRISSFSSSHAMDMAKEDPSMYYYPSGAILPPTPNEWTIVYEEPGDTCSSFSRQSTTTGRFPDGALLDGLPLPPPPKFDQSFGSPSHKSGSPGLSNCSMSSSHSEGPESFHRDRLHEPTSPLAGVTKLQQALLDADARWSKR